MTTDSTPSETTATTTPDGAAAPPRTLVLVRHSKASHSAPTDLERALTSKGHRMAEDLARDLADAIGSIDLLLYSSATRARQTAAPMEYWLTPSQARVEPEIYHEGPSSILALVSQLPGEVGRVVVVGHEPTISVLAHSLHDADDELASQVSFGIPTATALVLRVPGAWEDLGPSRAHLERIVTVPR